jgi:NAD(P)-dependent dehydrogenase (short-subunit alcohol dehydrogenase family)
MRLDGKVILLTGAGGLLGRALAERFVAEGAAGLILTDADAAALDATAAALGAGPDPGDAAAPDPGGTPVISEAADVRDSDAVGRLVDRAVAEHGRLDVMVNNAGVVSPNGRIHNLTPEDWRRAIDVNLFGVLHGIEHALRVMRPARSGSIVNTASVAGMTAWPYAAPYGVSKAAVIHLTKVAAVEYARDGIRVNCVCPGVFPSNMHRGVPEAAMESLTAKHPFGLGTPADVVGAFVYLASDDARWTTGAAVVVDGGYSLP